MEEKLFDDFGLEANMSEADTGNELIKLATTSKLLDYGQAEKPEKVDMALLDVEEKPEQEPVNESDERIKRIMGRIHRKGSRPLP
jgi:hypothetical protein